MALARDNKIYTWGVNDLGALGRDTSSDASDNASAEDSDSDDDESFLSARGSEDEGEGASIGSEDRGLASRHISPETRGRGRDVNISLEKPATIPSHVAPFGLMANLLRKTRQDSEQGEEDAEKPNEIGVARRDYFRAGAPNQIPKVFSDQLCVYLSVATPDPTARIADVDQDVYPDILTGSIVTPAEVEKLFKM